MIKYIFISQDISFIIRLSNYQFSPVLYTFILRKDLYDMMKCETHTYIYIFWDNIIKHSELVEIIKGKGRLPAILHHSCFSKYNYESLSNGNLKAGINNLKRINETDYYILLAHKFIAEDTNKYWYEGAKTASCILTPF